nr:ribonuclease Y-like [Aegilops tauschii subsp. strangulata]
MDAKCIHPRLALPTEAPQSDKGWPRAELTDERASSVLEQMTTNLKPGNAKAAKVTGAMLLMEFLMLRVAPLQARARPLWRLGDEEDMICLRPGALPDDELTAALRLLVGDNQEYPPSAFVPLFLRKDWEPIVASRPTFDARGLVPPALTEASATPKPVELALIPTQGGSSLVSRDAASALTPPGAASSPSAAPSSAPGARAPTPQAPTLSGFRLPKRKVDYVAVDQPVPSTKKRKEDTADAPPSPEEGGGSTRTSPARSPSRGQERHHRGESAPVALLAPEVSAPGSADEIPKALEPLISQAQAATASEEEKRATAKAAADREAALQDELKSLRDQHAQETRGRQAKEEEMKDREDAIRSRNAELVELAKAQATERSRLEALEQKRSSVALKSLYEKGLEKPLTTNEDGPAQLLPHLVKALEEVMEGIGPMAEAEARVLSSAALTRVFSHLYLRDPNARLDELLKPVANEHCVAAAAAMKGQVEALLKRFHGFVLAPSTGDATDPAAGGAGEGDATKGGAPSAGGGGV